MVTIANYKASPDQKFNCQMPCAVSVHDSCLVFHIKAECCLVALILLPFKRPSYKDVCIASTIIVHFVTAMLSSCLSDLQHAGRGNFWQGTTQSTSWITSFGHHAFCVLPRSRWPSTLWQDRRRSLLQMRIHTTLKHIRTHTNMNESCTAVICCDESASLQPGRGGHQDHKQEKDGAHEHAWKDQTGNSDLAASGLVSLKCQLHVGMWIECGYWRPLETLTLPHQVSDTPARDPFVWTAGYAQWHFHGWEAENSWEDGRNSEKRGGWLMLIEVQRC